MGIVVFCFRSSTLNTMLQGDSSTVVVLLAVVVVIVKNTQYKMICTQIVVY